MACEFKVRGTFGVRNDKFRGLLVETFETSNGNQYFFKYHQQPLMKHCEQLQILVKKTNIQRAKKLHVDMTPFLHEYMRVSDGAIIFQETKLESVANQIEKVYTMRINKEIGIAKRKQTMAANKQAKINASNKKIKDRYESAEAEFQAERARRIDRLFGGVSGQGNGGQQSSDTGMN